MNREDSTDLQNDEDLQRNLSGDTGMSEEQDETMSDEIR